MVQLQEMVKIGNASSKDIYAVLDIIEEEKFREDGSGTLLEVSSNELYSRIQKGNAFAAYVNDQLVGFASLIEYNGVAEMATLYVNPELRNLGISSMLKDKVVARAAEKGFMELYAYTNEDALPKFMKWGFRLTETTPEKLESYCLQCPKYQKSCDEKPVVLYSGS